MLTVKTIAAMHTPSGIAGFLKHTDKGWGTFAPSFQKPARVIFISQSRNARSAKAAGGRANCAIKQIADQSDKQYG